MNTAGYFRLYNTTLGHTVSRQVILNHKTTLRCYFSFSDSHLTVPFVSVTGFEIVPCHKEDKDVIGGGHGKDRVNVFV